MEKFRQWWGTWGWVAITIALINLALIGLGIYLEVHPNGT